MSNNEVKVSLKKSELASIAFACQISDSWKEAYRLLRSEGYSMSMEVVKEAFKGSRDESEEPGSLFDVR